MHVFVLNSFQTHTSLVARVVQKSALSSGLNALRNLSWRSKEESANVLAASFETSCQTAAPGTGLAQPEWAAELV